MEGSVNGGEPGLRQCQLHLGESVGFASPGSFPKIAVVWGVPELIVLAVVFLQGYNQQPLYIVAQSPLKDTRRDFWKMIFEREVPVIMMLCTTSEDGKVCSE